MRSTSKIFRRGDFQNRAIEVAPSLSSKTRQQLEHQFVTVENSRPPCRPAQLRESNVARATGEYASAYGPTPFLWSFRLTRHTTRGSRKDGTECPLHGPRARKGAGSGGTPDMADTREMQSNQAFGSPGFQICWGISCFPGRISRNLFGKLQLCESFLP